MNNDQPSFTERARMEFEGTDAEKFMLEEQDREAYWDGLEEDFLEGLVGQPREDEGAAHKVRGGAGSRDRGGGR